jgi:hypothetical protein
MKGKLADLQRAAANHGSEGFGRMGGEAKRFAAGVVGERLG